MKASKGTIIILLLIMLGNYVPFNVLRANNSIKIIRHSKAVRIAQQKEEELITCIEELLADMKDGLFLVVTKDMLDESKKTGILIQIRYGKNKVGIYTPFLQKTITIKAIDVLIYNEMYIVVTETDGRQHAFSLSDEGEKQIIDIIES